MYEELLEKLNARSVTLKSLKLNFSFLEGCRTFKQAIEVVEALGVKSEPTTPYATDRGQDDTIVAQALKIVTKRVQRVNVFSSPAAVENYLRLKYTTCEREVFSILHLDNQNRLIEHQELFYGTINAASVYPREVVKAVLTVNSANVILVHNHPSGISQPSNADMIITEKLKKALALIDVSILDHLIVGSKMYSFAEKGVL